MQRQIKFRAWNKRDKVMFPVDSMWWDGDWDDGEIEPYVPYEGEDLRCEPAEPSRLILMQYTGLHDRNGKEIYEGDLLVISGTTGIGAVTWNQRFARYDINGNFGSYSILIDYLPHIHFEVIGNIWENEDLRKSKQKGKN